MKLRTVGLLPKIAIGFGSLLTIIAGMGMVGYRSAVTNERTAHEMEAYSSMKDITSSMQQDLLTQRVGARDVLMGKGNELHLYEQGEQNFLTAMSELQPLLTSDDARGQFARTEAARANYVRRNDQVVSMYRAGEMTGAIKFFEAPDARVASDALADAMHDMTAAFWQQRQEALERQMTTDSRSKMLMLLFALAGVVVGATIAFVTAFSIVNGNRKILAMIDAISCNNLMTNDMEVLGSTEMGKAALGLNKMKNGLRRMILSIASTAENVSVSSREISVTAAHAAGSAEEQKQQVEQIATAMQEMAATVREVSQHSNTAASSAKNAAESAREGGRLMEDVLEWMRVYVHDIGEAATNIEHLGTRSGEIGRIVGVIEEIAEQTSLLALNAAIEAARAGEQGRGFAVVAGEVRRLAERTAGATKEISEVIQNVQSMTAGVVHLMNVGTANVERGVEATSNAGESIQRIIREADTVGTMVAQIACSATQQAAATEQVTASMGQISELAIESADGSRLSAHACEELLDLALGLQNMVARFDVGQRETDDARAQAAMQWDHAA